MTIPSTAVDAIEFSTVQKRLDDIEAKVEFANSEIQQSSGRTLGREVGILYGFMFGVLIYVAFSLLIKLRIV
jgi:tetrahydromethanopterin S-methyltransferase subunit G